MEFFLARIMSYMLAGLFSSLSAVIYFRTAGRIRRWLFRFGGESPLSRGTGSRWALWYFCALFTVLMIKLAFSFFFGIIPFVEFLLLPLQAFTFVVGLWAVDRVAMIFEPESHWRNSPTEDHSDPKKEERAAETAQKPRDENGPGAAIDDESSWIEKQADNAKSTVGAAAGTLKETINSATRNATETLEATRERIGGKIRGFFGIRRKKREEEQRAEESRQKKQLERFERLTKRHRRGE